MAPIKRSLVILCLLGLAGCSLFKQPDKFGARPVSFDALPNWHYENHAEALSAFLASCPAMEKKSNPAALSGLSISPELWQSLCADARSSQADPRGYFERRFTPYRVNNNEREEGLFTGYYEPMLYGSPRRQGDFQYPLYVAPPDLEQDEPYYSHAEINQGALDGKRLELIWLDDPVMRFFLQIQGSGRIKLMNGRELMVGYAGKNGQPYTAIGKIAKEEKLLPDDGINFFTLRQWMYKNPDKAFDLMERNSSYVFFKMTGQPGAVGSVGVVLTPERSLAVDSRYIPYGLPLWLETELPAEPQRTPTPFKRLMIAQDTGGAIKGPVRGDIFFGHGDQAEYYAGMMKGRGVYSLLVPKEITGQVQP